MSQVGWYDEKGKIIPFDEALTIAQESGTFMEMPYEVLRAMRDNITHERPDAISVSQLLGCPRRVYLQSITDYADTAENGYAAFRGSIVHAILAEQTSDNADAEKRIERVYKGVTLSGQPDSVRLIDAGKRRLLRDWKSTKRLPLYDAYTQHQAQVNIYRWLLGLDWRLTDLELVYISMEGLRIVPLKRGGTNRLGRAIPNQIMTDAEVEAFLDTRLMLLNAQREHDSPITYMNVDEEHLWECAWCPVRQLCYTRAADEAKNAWSKGETVTRIPPREVRKRGKK